MSFITLQWLGNLDEKIDKLKTTLGRGLARLGLWAVFIFVVVWLAIIRPFIVWNFAFPKLFWGLVILIELIHLFGGGWKKRR